MTNFIPKTMLNKLIPILSLFWYILVGFDCSGWLILFLGGYGPKGTQTLWSDIKGDRPLGEMQILTHSNLAKSQQLHDACTKSQTHQIFLLRGHAQMSFAMSFWSTIFSGIFSHFVRLRSGGLGGFWSLDG